MYRIYIALIEIVAAAVFIIPIWCVYNKLYFRSWKMTILYMVFGFYLTAVLALVAVSYTHLTLPTKLEV
mgnify:CR=1 FL=1